MLSLDGLTTTTAHSDPALMPSLVDLDAQVSVRSRPNPGYVPEREPCQFGTEYAPGIHPYLQMAVDQPVCGGCGTAIRERYLLKVSDEYWHETCLVCNCCSQLLADRPSCYIREQRVYCVADYKALYSLKCGRCCQPLHPTDMVYRCLSNAFHLDCFSCIYCGQHLRKGDQYLVVEGQIVCRQDYELFLYRRFSGYYDPETGESNRKTPKRPRTILTSSQRRAFKQSFEMSAKPCRKVREALAKETGLSVRVVQVWFQNQRAKMKKIQRKQELQKLHESRKTSSEQSHASGDKAPKSTSDDDKASSIDDLGSDDSDAELEKENGHSEEPKQTIPVSSGNPIDKLYSMQDSYFF